MKKREILKKFIAEHNVHKKELADCIGVTLSYIYNLIDESLDFTTREITLIRLATVTGSPVGEFTSNNPYARSKQKIKESELVEDLKEAIRAIYKNTITFLRKFPIDERLEIVDILAGLKSVPIDYKKFERIFKLAGFYKAAICDYWQAEFIKFLDENGFNSSDNKDLLEAMFSEGV